MCFSRKVILHAQERRKFFFSYKVWTIFRALNKSEGEKRLLKNYRAGLLNILNISSAFLSLTCMLKYCN